MEGRLLDIHGKMSFLTVADCRYTSPRSKMSSSAGA